MFQSRIPKITAEMMPALDAVISEAADAIIARAQERVPVLSGDLRDAIHKERVGPAEYEVIAGNDKVFYGHIVEHGGAHRAAHPFLIPALEESAPEVVGIAAAVLRRL